MCTGEMILQSPVQKHPSSAWGFSNDWHSTGIVAVCQCSQALLISRCAESLARGMTAQMSGPSLSLQQLWIAVITFDFTHACGWLAMRNAKANSSIYLTSPKNSRAELRLPRKWNQLSPFASGIWHVLGCYFLNGYSRSCWIVNIDVQMGNMCCH